MKQKPVDKDIRDEVRRRADGKCQACGKAAFDAADPAEAVLEYIIAPGQITLYRWSKNCWTCGESTPVATYCLVADRPYTLGDIGKLDYTLMAKYPFIRKRYSRPLESEVVANACVACGAQQGNLYVAEEIQAQIAADEGTGQLVDDTIPNTLTLDDINPPPPELTAAEPADAVAHVHHVDGNPHNNEPANLALLCRACHVAAHHR